MVIQHASSSNANFYEIKASNGRRLLIELGLKWKQTQKVLSYNLKEVAGAIVSHGHL